MSSQNGNTNPFYEIELVDGRIILFDADGSSYECRQFASYREAKRTIRVWTKKYILRIGECYRRLDEYFARLAA
jgi:hypothetical protein